MVGFGTGQVQRQKAKLVCRPKWKEHPCGWSYKIFRAMGPALGSREPASLSVRWRKEYRTFSRLDKAMWALLCKHYSLEGSYQIESNLKKQSRWLVMSCNFSKTRKGWSPKHNLCLTVDTWNLDLKRTFSFFSWRPGLSKCFLEKEHCQFKVS